MLVNYYYNFFYLGPANVGHLFDHLLWSIFQSAVTQKELLYTLKITVYCTSAQHMDTFNYINHSATTTGCVLVNYWPMFLLNVPLKFCRLNFTESAAPVYTKTGLVTREYSYNPELMTKLTHKILGGDEMRSMYVQS